jgi:hypothetical protein
MLGLTVRSIVIDRPNGMKNVPRRERAGSRNYRAASGATARTRAYFVQLAHDGRATCAMNRPIHSSSAAQPRVRGIDDGVYADLSDIADHQAELLAVMEIDLHVANRTANAIVKVETIRRAGAF